MLGTLSRIVRNLGHRIEKEDSAALVVPIQTCLALIVDKFADKASSLCRWITSAEYMGGNTFGRPALPMMWDFCEANVFGKVTGPEFRGKNTHYIDSFALRSLRSIVFRMSSCFLVRVTTREI